MANLPRHRVAMTIPGPTANVADSIAMAKRLEQLGWDDIWLADAGGLDALTLVPMLLARDRKYPHWYRGGTGVHTHTCCSGQHICCHQPGLPWAFHSRSWYVQPRHHQ